MSACAPDADTRSASSRPRAKLAVLLWCLLSRSEDHAHQQPSLTATKLRLLEIRAGSKTLKGTNTGTWATRQKMRTAERALAQTGRGLLQANGRRLASSGGEERGRERDIEAA